MKLTDLLTQRRRPSSRKEIEEQRLIKSFLMMRIVNSMVIMIKFWNLLLI